MSSTYKWKNAKETTHCNFLALFFYAKLSACYILVLIVSGIVCSCELVNHGGKRMNTLSTINLIFDPIRTGVIDSLSSWFTVV